MFEYYLIELGRLKPADAPINPPSYDDARGEESFPSGSACGNFRGVPEWKLPAEPEARQIAE